MCKLSEDELWERVRRLKGKPVYSIERHKPNLVQDVTNSEVIIDGRDSPIPRKQISAAYENVRLCEKSIRQLCAQK